MPAWEGEVRSPRATHRPQPLCIGPLLGTGTHPERHCPILPWPRHLTRQVPLRHHGAGGEMEAQRDSVAPLSTQ